MKKKNRGERERENKIRARLQMYSFPSSREKREARRHVTREDIDDRVVSSAPIAELWNTVDRQDASAGRKCRGRSSGQLAWISACRV